MIDAAEQIYSFAEFEVDANKRRLLKNAQAVALNPKAFNLLLVLIENRGQIVLKEELLETVWANQFVEENNLTVHISALRKIFGEKKNDNRFIATIPGKGYKFVAELNDALITNPNDEIIIENHRIERITIEEEIAPKTKRLSAEQNSLRRFRIAALVAVVIAAVAAGYWFWTKNQPTAAPIESIAVMPFVYENGTAENEYLSDGMTESLINNLSQIPNLTVKARASVFYYKGKEIAPPKVGSELNVQAVLLGRISERGDGLNISLELVNAKTNNHLWGEQYTRKLSDLAVLQTEIARDVSAKLRRKLANDETLQKGQTTHAEAYQLYLKGRFFWNKRQHEDHLKALAAFEQAIALDPNFALAYAGIGDVYTVDSFRGTDEEKDSKGRAAAQKALEIEPNLAEAYTVLAKIEWNSFRRDESEKYFKRALEINPNYASARQWYAEFLTQQARTDEAIIEIKRALELDPLSQIINSDAIYIYTMARQYDNAVAQADKLLELNSNWNLAYLWRATAHEARGDYRAAIADFEKDNELSNKPSNEKEARRDQWKKVRAALEKSGESGYWEQSLELVKDEPQPDQYFMAFCYAKLGDKENALASLEKALEEKNHLIDLMKVEPYFDNLQSEPRFQTLLRRIGLMP